MSVIDDGPITWNPYPHFGYPNLYSDLINGMNQRRIFIAMPSIAVPPAKPYSSQSIDLNSWWKSPNLDHANNEARDMLTDIQSGTIGLQSSSLWKDSDGSTYSGYDHESVDFSDRLTWGPGIDSLRQSISEHRYKGTAGNYLYFQTVAWQRAEFGPQWVFIGDTINYWDVSDGQLGINVHDDWSQPVAIQYSGIFVREATATFLRTPCPYTSPMILGIDSYRQSTEGTLLTQHFGQLVLDWQDWINVSASPISVASELYGYNRARITYRLTVTAPGQSVTYEVPAITAQYLNTYWTSVHLSFPDGSGLNAEPQTIWIG